MRIPCPFCGERDLQEFSVRGEAVEPQRANVAPAAAFEAVYLRGNPAGRLRELWYHAAGCRAWLVVTRDTRTHAIEAVEPARDLMLAAPRAEAGGAA